MRNWLVLAGKSLENRGKSLIVLGGSLVPPSPPYLKKPATETGFPRTVNDVSRLADERDEVKGKLHFLDKFTRLIV